jgi:6,7-dimethyl-8-ribityllumazine synthase
MRREVRASLDATGKKFAFVVSRYSGIVSDRLVAEAEDCLIRHGARAEDITVYWVPGAFEIPLLAQRLAQQGAADAVLALGAVIRGETSHHELVGGQVARGVMQAALSTGVPVIFGVVTVEHLEQALERTGVKGTGRGWDTALSAIEMANLTVIVKKKTK